MARRTALGDYLGGLVAAEGTFAAVPETGASAVRPTRFTFAVALGAVDIETVELLRAFLGVGRIRRYERRRPHYDDEVVFAVRALGELAGAVVPFLDEHLPPCHKRTQYLAWRDHLAAHLGARTGRPPLPVRPAA